MKKTAITAILTLSMIGSISTAAVATPANTVANNPKVIAQQKAYDAAKQQLETAQTNLEQVSNEINILMGQINENNYQIKQNEAQLKVFTAEYQKDLQVEAARIKAIYQNGNNTGFLSLMLTSKNLGEFISRYFAVSQLMKLDAKATQKTLAAKNSMEATTQKLNELKASNESKLTELNSKKATAQALVKKMQSNSAYQEQKLEQAKANAQASINLLNEAKTVSEVNNAVTALKHIAATTTNNDVKAEVNNAITKSSQKLTQIQNHQPTEPVVQAPVAKTTTPIAKTPTTTTVTPAVKQVAPASSQTKTITPNATPQPKKVAPASQPEKVAPASQPEKVAPASNSALGQQIVSYAENFLGRPYVWGALGPNAFDCSGLTHYVYSHFGYEIGDSTYSQIDEGTPVSKNNLQAGDLIFWGDPSAPYHVAIYIGGGEYIQAPHTGANVDISSWNLNNISAARRII